VRFVFRDEQTLALYRDAHDGRSSRVPDTRV